MNRRKYFDHLAWVGKAVATDATRHGLLKPHFMDGRLMGTDGRRLHVVYMDEPPQDYEENADYISHHFQRVPEVIPKNHVFNLRLTIKWKEFHWKEFYKYCKDRYAKSTTQAKARSNYSPVLIIRPNEEEPPEYEGLVKIEGWPDEGYDEPIYLNLCWLKDCVNDHEEFDMAIAGPSEHGGYQHQAVTLTCDSMPNALAVLMPLRDSRIQPTTIPLVTGENPMEQDDGDGD